MVQTIWNQFQNERSEKARLKSSLRAAIGYGGMIHEFKNLVLRKKISRGAIVHSHLGAAQAIIDQYSVLELDNTERVALEDIRQVFRAYEKALIETLKLIAQGKNSHQIDQLVKVDDSTAFRGLIALNSKLHTGGSLAKVKKSKGQLVAELRASLGYGGMIHHFKNYILRHNQEITMLIFQHIDQADNIIAQYHQLEPTSAELIALNDLSQTLTKYRKNLKKAIILVEQKKSTEVIDSVLKIDDSFALRGMRLLDKEIAAQIVHRVGEVDSSLQRVNQLVKVTSWVSIVLITMVVFFLSLLMYKLIIFPIQQLTEIMDDLSKNNFDINIPKIDGKNEIARMSQSVLIFKENAFKRQQAEDQLAESHHKQAQQIEDIYKLKEQAEKQVREAVSLAGHLASSQETTIAALSRAENGEKRVTSILNTMMDAIITTDNHGIIEDFNPSAEAIFGYQTRDVLGQNISLLMPEPHKSHHDAYIQNYFSDQSSHEMRGSFEQHGLHKNGSIFPIEISLGVMQINGETKFTGVIRDISERKEAEKEIHRLALTDPLTGLANRNQFNSKLSDALKQVNRLNMQVALMLLDLDKFKPVNDTYGHPVGDSLLKWVSDNLVALVREVDTVARLGGDEFAIIFCGTKEELNISVPAKKIIKKLAEQVEIDGHLIQIGTSIGISFIDTVDADAEELILKADKALYQAKNKGRNRYEIYHNDKN